MPKSEPTLGQAGKPLAKKLGLSSAKRTRLIDAPANYRSLFDPPLPAGGFTSKPPLDFVHLFTNERAKLAKLLPNLCLDLAPDGMIWVSWHKKSANLPTDITEDTIREIALPLGLVDVKVCAVSETWSGLKLVLRKELR